MNMKNCGRRNFRKPREIKGNYKNVTLEISLEFYSLYKMRITSSESKDNVGRSGKGLITSLVINAKVRPKKCKKARYAIGYVRNKVLSNIIRDFENLSYKSYERKRPKHEPNDRYFYLERHIVKCMMRADVLNLHA